MSVVDFELASNHQPEMYFTAQGAGICHPEHEGYDRVWL